VIFIFNISMNFFCLHGSRTPTSNFLPPFSVLQRYVIYFDLPNLFLNFFVGPAPHPKLVLRSIKRFFQFLQPVSIRVNSNHFNFR